MPLLHSVQLGSGTPMIILHGFLGMSDNWKTLGSKYAEMGFAVHLLDQRNHGRSFHSPEFNYKCMVADLNDYFQHYGIDKAVMLGHSMGGKTAMNFAVSFPEKVEKLLVADIAPRYYPPHHKMFLDALDALSQEHIESREQAEELLKIHVKEAVIRMFLMKNLYRDELGGLKLRLNIAVLKHSSEAIGEALNAENQYFGETVFLKGQLSDYITAEDEKDIKKWFPRARIEIVEGAGHWLHSENPALFLATTKRFL